jgi:hypothetical protein
VFPLVDFAMLALELRVLRHLQVGFLPIPRNYHNFYVLISLVTLMLCFSHLLPIEPLILNLLP